MNERVKDVLANVLGVPVDTISDSFSASDCEHWTSLKQLTLIVALEEQFSIQVAEEKIAELHSVPLILEYLHQHANG